MEGAMLVTWGGPVPGREAKGLEVFGKSLAMSEKAAKEGRIHGHKEYFALTGNATALSGFQVIEGDLDQLHELQREDDWLQLQMEAGAITQNFSVTFCAGGSDSAVQEIMQVYMKASGNLGYL